MVERLISLASGVVPELDPIETFKVAIKTGYNAVGLMVIPERDLNSNTIRELTIMSKNENIRILDIEVLMLEPGDFIDDHLRILDLGGEIGAMHSLTVSNDSDINKTSEKFNKICNHAKDCGIKSVFEFLMITKYRNLDDVINVLDLTESENKGILIDTLHFQRANHKASDINNYNKNLFPYLQLCDGEKDLLNNEYEDYLDDALNGRSAPGEGNLPLKDIIKEFSLSLPFSLEVRSKYYRESYKNVYDRAGKVLSKTLEYLNMEI